jgi:hypothetical protein
MLEEGGYLTSEEVDGKRVYTIYDRHDWNAFSHC